MPHFRIEHSDIAQRERHRCQLLLHVVPTSLVMQQRGNARIKFTFPCNKHPQTKTQPSLRNKTPRAHMSFCSLGTASTMDMSAKQPSSAPTGALPPAVTCKPMPLLPILPPLTLCAGKSRLIAWTVDPTESPLDKPMTSSARNCTGRVVEVRMGLR